MSQIDITTTEVVTQEIAGCYLLYKGKIITDINGVWKTTEQIIMEDQMDGEAGLTEVHQGKIMEVTRTNTPIIDLLTTNTTVIVSLDQQIDRMTENQKTL